MAYQNEKQKQSSEKKDKNRPEEQEREELISSKMPNSLMWDMPLMPPPGTPNSVMREMMSRQIPEAEAEATRLSAGITSGSPNSVRKEMGKRLGSDFSSIHFHSGPDSVRKNEAMGARAYTRGSDIWFGKGGFDPSVAAHELVHTVQQGVVRGNASQAVPAGTVQMLPHWLERLLGRSDKDDHHDDNHHDDIPEDGDELIGVRKGPAPEPADAEAEAEAAAAVPEEEPAKEELPEAPKKHKQSKKKKKKKHKREDAPKAEERQPEEAGGDDAEASHARRGHKGHHKHRERRAEQQITPEEKQAIRILYRQDQELRGVTNPTILDYCPLLDERKELKSSEKESLRNFLEQVRRQGPDTIIQHDQERQRRRADEAAANARQAEEPAPRRTDFYARPTDPIRKESRLRKFLHVKQLSLDAMVEEYKAQKGLNRNDADQRQNRGDDVEQVRNPMDRALAAGVQATEHYVEGELAGAGNGNAQAAEQSDGLGTIKKFKRRTDLVRNSDVVVNGSFLTDAAKRHDWKSADDISKKWKNTKIPGMGIVADAGSVLGGAAGMETGFIDTLENIEKYKSGGSGWDVAESISDTLGSTASSLSGAIGMTSKAISWAGAAKAAAPLANQVVPGLNVVSGAASAFTGAVQGTRGVKALIDLKEQKKKLNEPGTVMNAEDDKNLHQILNQGQHIAARNAIGGYLKAASGAISVGTGIATLVSGPLAPVTAGALAITSGALSAFKTAYEFGSKKYMQRKILAEDMNINWSAEMRDVERMFPNMWLRNKEIRAIILRGRGFKGETWEAAAKEVNWKRADYLVDKANMGFMSNDPAALVAISIIQALGISPRGGSFDEGAKKLLAEKLG